MVGVRQFDEDRLLGQALEVFWRKGLRATTMLDLANATGVLRGSLYNAYGDKDALFLMAFERYAGRFLDSARVALSNPDPRQALLAFFDVAIANMTEGSPPKGCLTTRTATESDPTTGAIQRRLRTLLDDLQAIVHSALSSETACKGLTLEPAEAALVIVTFTRGLAVMERVYQNRKRLRDAAHGLVRALTNGNSTRAPRSRRTASPRRAG
jgi:TetR/AcrR family transcriptional regulator, transcriptional repressor for nem operon